MNNEKKSKKMMLIGVSITAIITLLIGSLLAFNKEKQRLQEMEPEKVFVGHSESVSDNAYEELLKNVMEIEKNTNDEELKKQLGAIIADQEDKEVTIDNFNRVSAVKSLQTLLINVGENPDGKEQKPEESVKARLEMLDKEETDMKDVLVEKAINKLYMAEEFEKNKFNRKFAASSMLIYYDIITGNGNAEIEPLIESYDDLVYLDTRFMTAHIPLDLFIGGNTGIAFQMQFVDGEWKLNPYTAMQSLNLMSVLNAQQEEPIKEPAKEEKKEEKKETKPAETKEKPAETKDKKDNK